MKKPKLPSNRNLGIVFSLVFLAIGLYPLINDNDVRIWSLVISLIFLLLGILNAKILTPLNKFWFKLGILLGTFIAPIVMGFVFFLVVTPIGLLIKLLGKDLIGIKKNNSKSYWIEKPDQQTSMKNQF